ncbi:acyl-CoA dehydrogenase AcdA (plasmid) [Cupriavidus necator N-1]|uniref:Acyl-CoA dehydrogenase AcdA n=1 Tax=Cupriavidus necator (strain ATCC 43291 / DSM 13513 / CCUG 52238 / LMG 8453 / N-1) TaxID=1042878 RepID=F8GUW7_CUPNN|nr:acyl-CoA dehydrogenase family protein [Cupriavidus necator]AEI82521.1 acyl-CoA dehydrogenase AcdA [Cupriavidus necator N-1]MDX6007519.1 acyl-CoA dehydrogenase family protein [Cupriavidus necator]
MDFRADPNLTQFRQQVRTFLRDHLPADTPSRNHGMRSPRDTLVAWQSTLNRQGWGAPSWASEHGGPGWTVQQRLVFDEECALAGAPSQDNFAQKLVGPVINHFGTPAQREEHIGAILCGDRIWCQGFSEPGSGSDLASLRTQAMRDGDDYIINGQKTWTSYAHHADWIFLLVRTGAGERKQAGISFLLVDMKTPGITVRPIISIDGCHHLNETFFDNVRVPATNLIGEEGRGWQVTKFLLNNEHAFTADLPTLRRMQRQLRTVAAAPAQGRALRTQPQFALRLARYEAEMEAVSVLVQRVAALEQAGDHSATAHALGSVLKILGTELQQQMGQFLVESLGDYAPVAYPFSAEGSEAEPLPMQDTMQDLATEAFFRRATTIYGGTSEIQRGIIAKAKFQL